MTYKCKYAMLMQLNLSEAAKDFAQANTNAFRTERLYTPSDNSACREKIWGKI